MKSTIISNRSDQRISAFGLKKGKAGDPGARRVRFDAGSSMIAGLRSGGVAAMRMKAGRGQAASARGQSAACSEDAVLPEQIGQASSRERGCQYLCIT